jgi:hypothetical protein
MVAPTTAVPVLEADFDEDEPPPTHVRHMHAVRPTPTAEASYPVPVVTPHVTPVPTHHHHHLQQQQEQSYPATQPPPPPSLSTSLSPTGGSVSTSMLSPLPPKAAGAPVQRLSERMSIHMRLSSPAARADAAQQVGPCPLPRWPPLACHVPSCAGLGSVVVCDDD